MDRFRANSTLSWILLAAVIAIGGLVVGCGSSDDSSSSSEETPTFAMGIEPWIGYAPWWIVEEKGFDEANGFNLELTNFTQDTDAASAFAAGQVEAENTSLNGGLVDLAAGQPLSFILFEDVSTTADAMLAGPDIQSIEDLQGKSVAFEEGSTSDILLRYALDEAGMTLDDVEVVHLPAAQAGSAAIAGKVDAAVTYEPYLTAALNKGDGFHLLYTAGERPGLISDLLAVNTEFAKANPELMQNALLAWNDAVEFYNSNTEEAQAIIAEKVGADPADLATTFDGVKLFDLEQSQAFLTEDYATLSDAVEEIITDAGVLEGDPDMAAALNTTYGEDALAKADE